MNSVLKDPENFILIAWRINKLLKKASKARLKESTFYLDQQFWYYRIYRFNVLLDHYCNNNLNG